MQQNTETCDHCVNGIEKDRDRMKQNGSKSQILMCIYCAFTYVYTSIPPFSKSVRGRSGALVPIRVESVGLGGMTPFIVYVMVVSVRVIAVTHIICHHVPMKSVCQCSLLAFQVQLFKGTRSVHRF